MDFYSEKPTTPRFGVDEDETQKTTVTAERHADGTIHVTDIKNEQKPRICPVTGMFLDEPKHGEMFWCVNMYGYPFEREWADNHLPSADTFLIGNCFATREAAERYAKHLKAMAKLRRLGGLAYDFSDSFTSFKELAVLIPGDRYNQLTPEEQNALQWPNEEK
jgi:hypothetical protein